MTTSCFVKGLLCFRTRWLLDWYTSPQPNPERSWEAFQIRAEITLALSGDGVCTRDTLSFDASLRIILAINILIFIFMPCNDLLKDFYLSSIDDDTKDLG
jgi:hypothetical protein